MPPVRGKAIAWMLGLGAGGALSGAAETGPAPLAERARTASVFTFYLENDYFGGTNRHYTNGVKLSWLSRDLTTWGQVGWRQKLIEALPLVNQPGTQKNFGVALGQNIYTPENDDLHVPDPTDRPYAGWSYLEFNLISKTSRLMDALSLQVGVIGRHSYAQETQHLVHDWLRNDQAKGWAFQLKDEIGVNVIFERRWRMFARGAQGAVGFDIVPHVGVSVGNVQTFANLGATARVGFNLPSDFGIELIAGGAATNSPLDDHDPRVGGRRRTSLFVFGGVDGRAVARDIFLDGNTWADSRSVDKEPLVGDSYWGVGLVLNKWQLTYTYVVRSKEFKAQRDVNQFGSLAISRAF
jgi:lipid A 3-O-deacylase